MRQFLYEGCFVVHLKRKKRERETETTNLVDPGYIVKSCITDEMSG